ncbi:copper resistance CopC family protein [Sphaerisporangium fuscum]|uniref:copper resistance CopC family protein n=1 Tax=Sphaerisporangium fuscum TaxID=2835868 RepID=UPI001BDBFDCE|nr:copper resistance CopC family protein [Sphaerisporangium fuscum]
MRTSLRAALAFIIAAVLGTAFAAPALAHTSLKSSDPAKGATVESLDSVTLTFTESVGFPVVLVRDAAGKDHGDGKAKADGPKVTRKIAGTLPSGKYTIAWRVVSDDGHPVQGEIPFTVKAAAESAPVASEISSPMPTLSASLVATDPPAASTAPASQSPAARQEQSSGGIPVWVWIVVFGIAGIGIGMAISLRKKP